MVYPTAQGLYGGGTAYRDSRTGRWASRAAYLAQVEAIAARAAEARVFAGALMMALCRPVLGSSTPSRAARHAIHQELGRKHPGRPLRTMTPAQERFYGQAAKWGFA